MNVGFGKFKDVDVRRLLLRHPDYVKWVLGEANPKRALAALATQLKGYMKTFDGIPFVEDCLGKSATGRCQRTAVQGTAYASHSGLSVDLFWWCDQCDPYQRGAARSARLIPVRTYSEALAVVDRHGGRKSDYMDIIKNLSEAKGLPKRVTANVLDTFFGQ